jgi:hypothetical protein
VRRRSALPVPDRCAPPERSVTPPRAWRKANAPRGTAALARRPANSSGRVFMARARLLHIPGILAIAFLATNLVGLAPQGTWALRRRWPNSVGSVGTSILGRHLNPNRQVPRKFAGRIAGPPVVLGTPSGRALPPASAKCAGIDRRPHPTVSSELKTALPFNQDFSAPAEQSFLLTF